MCGVKCTRVLLGCFWVFRRAESSLFSGWVCCIFRKTYHNKTVGLYYVAWSTGISGQWDLMQCGKACVEWVVMLSPPTLPLYDTWQKFTLHGHRAYFEGSRICLFSYGSPEFWNETLDLFSAVGLIIVLSSDKKLAVNVIKQGVCMCTG